MRVIDTITLPFCTVTIAETLNVVSSLDELPDFLLPVKWVPKSATEQEIPSTGVVERDATLSLYFSNVKQDTLKGRQADTFAERFAKSPGFGMLENAILYALTVVRTRGKVREYLGNGDGAAVHSFHVPPFTPKSRDAMIDSMIFKTVDKKDVIVIGGEGVKESIQLSLGNGVILFSKPHDVEAPPPGGNRFRGVIGILDSTQNFVLRRLGAPNLFRQFVSEELLQDAYANAAEKLENSSVLGPVLRLSESLDFVDDATEMHSTYKRDEEVEE